MAGVKIERTDDPLKANWRPIKSARGLQLVDRRIPYPDRNRTVNATFVRTCEEAADLIEHHGHGIRMGPPGSSRGNYIYPKSLKITRS